MENTVEKKMYAIKYSVVGEKRTDVMYVYETNIIKAIEYFETIEMEIDTIKFNYSRYAIISVSSD